MQVRPNIQSGSARLEKTKARLLLAEFTESFDLSEMKMFLREAALAYLEKSDGDIWMIGRKDFTYRYRELDAVLDAVFIQHKKADS
jgi:hypothetical protein